MHSSAPFPATSHQRIHPGLSKSKGQELRAKGVGDTATSCRATVTTSRATIATSGEAPRAQWSTPCSSTPSLALQACDNWHTDLPFQTPVLEIQPLHCDARH